ADPLGKHGGMNIFNWYFSGSTEFRDPLFKPEPGPNLEEVRRMFDESGVFIFGRRTYDITHGWNGRHPVNNAPVFILTHNPPPLDTVPRGPSSITFVTTASRARSARPRWLPAPGTSSSAAPRLANRRSG